jgi:ABC-type ATPase with predicted acetyltransferase domain
VGDLDEIVADGERCERHVSADVADAVLDHALGLGIAPLAGHRLQAVVAAESQEFRMIMETAPMLEVRNLAVRYGGIQALHDLSLSVPKGSIVTLIGANGAGKSTTLRTISGPLTLLADSSGLSLDVVNNEVAVVNRGRRSPGCAFSRIRTPLSRPVRSFFSSTQIVTRSFNSANICGRISSSGFFRLISNNRLTSLWFASGRM